MSAFFWPHAANPSHALSVRLGRALHRAATAISVVLLAVAVILLAVAGYQAVTNSGEWANDYWFNPDWVHTGSWAVLALALGVVMFSVGRLIRFLMSGE